MQKEDNRYQRGKIYKIVDNTNDNVYVGSTTEPTLARRLAKHVANYTAYLKGNKTNYITSFIIFKNKDYYIELLELVPCNSKDELLVRERHYIKSIVECINKNIPGRNKAEYYEDNKERRTEYQRKYSKQNKDKIDIYQKEYNEINKDRLKDYRKQYQEINKEKQNKKCICACGGKYTHQNKSNHEKTKLHQNYINSYDEE